MLDSGHANPNLTPEERRMFFQLFQAADKTKLGVVTGEVAVPFFEKTRLSPETLGVIWQIADKENRGLLTPSGFSMVLRLIGHAQAGRVPTEELALQPGPLPRFDGLVLDAPPARASSTASPPPATPIRVPPLNPEEIQNFSTLFEKSETHNGVISGETAKQIFERAKLPNEVLGRIWNLADTKQRGQLDVTEFIVAMHLLTSYKTGTMRGVPQTLPSGLYEAVSRRGARTSTGSRSGLDIPPVPAIPKQFTGASGTQSPVPRHPFSSSLSTQSTGGEWLITPQEKARFDNLFATVDVAKSGVINGDQAVTFFTNAQLPEDVLAQIWDLADIDADGQLTKDEFAVAMYLVRQQRSKKEPLPATIPQGLIPPGMRRQVARHPVQSSLAAPVAVVPRPAAEDLFGLDAFGAAPSTAAPVQVPQSTGGSASAFQIPGSPSLRASPKGALTFKPFIPSSQFGQSLNPQLTGLAGAASSKPPAANLDDLLGDNDPEESKKLTQETTELANLSNQIGSLAKEMQDVQLKRVSVELEVSQSSQQKRDFEARLAQARTKYEKELKDFTALEELLSASRAEAKKLQQELALIEGSREDLQSQYNQVSAALTTDQNENAALKEKIRQATVEVGQLKPALEKARSEARQQKGLVAINKKQLVTVEAEREKTQWDIDALLRETQEAVESGTPIPPAAPNIASPAISVASQKTNPFFRRTTTGSTDNILSPPESQQNAFDSIFGPTLATPSNPTPPPPTSFTGLSLPVQQTADVIDVSKTPDTSTAPTPSVSPPPSIAGPSLISQSNQIAPNFISHGDGTYLSVTSSTKDLPPASQFDQPETSALGTPVKPASPTAASGPTDLSNIALTSAEKDKPVALSPFGESKVASPAQATQDTSGPTMSRNEFPAISDDLAASAVASTEEISNPAKDPSFDELFGGPARERSQSQRAHDFEEAFAALNTDQNKTTDDSNEFPPIREFDNDEDSSDGEAQTGFDDNFDSASPPRNGERSQNDSIDTWQLQAFPAPGTGASPILASKTQSSPGSDQSVHREEPANSLSKHNGVPTEPKIPSLPTDNTLNIVEPKTSTPVAPGESQEHAGRNGLVAPSEREPAAPDFDAAFAGLDLAPAKEEEDSSDDDRFNKTSYEFDFSFDSPPQQTQPVTSVMSPGTGGVETSDFFNFDNNVNPSAAHLPSNPGVSQSTASNKGNTQHDWDSIFAPLAGPKGSDNGSSESTNHADSVSSTAPDNRQPGWALAAESGEDDLILQRLTTMGYPRDESLAALEKFDYNIDKAADYLTSSS